MLTFKPFSSSDFEVYQLWFNDESIKKALGSIDTEWLEYVLNDKTGREYAVFEKGQMVAVVGITFPIEDSPSYCINNIAVSPSLSRSGIGRRVIQQLVTIHLLQSGQFWKAYVEKDNHVAQVFFTKNKWLLTDNDSDGMLEYRYFSNLQRILLLSDLWGHFANSWVEAYQDTLGLSYHVEFVDMVKLGKIKVNNPTEELLHKQFIKSGISEASKALINKVNPADIVIGCSIGGVVAWKTALAGVSMKKLICISSTRLRYAKRKPYVSTKLIFGENDPNKPSKSWFENMNIDNVTAKGGHEIYKNKQIITKYVLPSVRSKK